MRFIFKHSHTCHPDTFSISVTVLGSHWLKRIINSRYDVIWTFQPTLYIYIYIYIYIYTHTLSCRLGCVTLCRWSAKQTMPLFWRETRQRVWTRDLNETGSRKGTPVREWDKGTEKELATDNGQGSRHRTAERSVKWDAVQSSERRRVKMSQHSSWVVEFLQEIHASVSLYMVTGM